MSFVSYNNLVISYSSHHHNDMPECSMLHDRHHLQSIEHHQFSRMLDSCCNHLSSFLYYPSCPVHDIDTNWCIEEEATNRTDYIPTPPWSAEWKNVVTLARHDEITWYSLWFFPCLEHSRTDGCLRGWHLGFPESVQPIFLPLWTCQRDWVSLLCAL